MNAPSHNMKKFAIQLFYEIFGSICIAAAIYNFAVQAEFPMTGFSGISIILYRLLNIPIGLSTVLLNIPVAALCYKLLGKKFFISSIRCMLISSFFIDYIELDLDKMGLELVVVFVNILHYATYPAKILVIYSY